MLRWHNHNRRLRRCAAWMAQAGLLLLVPWMRPPTPDPSPTAQTAQCTSTQGEIRQATVESVVYAAPVPVNMYLPPCYAAATEPYPVLYLLHGGNADETQWPDVGVAAAADALWASDAAAYVIVMPGGTYSAQIDYGAFVMDDLLPGIETHLHVRTDRHGRAIGGISLGGFWALQLAFTHPDAFIAVGGHSPVVRRGQANDPILLAATAKLASLRVALDAGSKDGLRTSTSQLARVLRNRKVAVALRLPAGSHNRSYWRSQTPAYLAWYQQAFATP